MEQTKEKQIFERMPVPEAVFTLAVPTVISQLIVLIYNLADTWFIGKTGDTLQVAAVTVSYPVFIFGLHMNVAGAVLATCLFLANLMWPMYGLMLVQPFMEFSGSMIALGIYRKQQGTGLTYRHRILRSHLHRKQKK